MESEQTFSPAQEAFVKAYMAERKGQDMPVGITFLEPPLPQRLLLLKIG